MLNTDTPAGDTSGQSTTSARGDEVPGGNSAEQGTFEIPAKLRVHALAKKLGSTSREVIRTLQELGEPVRSAQSNITREVALRVIESLFPERVVNSGASTSGDGTVDGAVSGGAATQDSATQAATSTGGEATPQAAEPVSAGAPAASTTSTATGSNGSVPEATAPDTAVESSSKTESGRPLAPVFAAPEATFLEPEQSTGGQQMGHTKQQDEARTSEDEEGRTEQDAGRRSKKQRNVGQSAAPAATGPEQESDNASAKQPQTGDDDQDESTEQDEDEQGVARRRRRRGRRGRGRGRGGEEQAAHEQDAQEQGSWQDDTAANGDAADTTVEEAAPDTSADGESDASGGDDTGSDGDSGSRRRRRRRRRKGGGDEETSKSNTREDDPPDTVVHVRDSTTENRQDSSGDEVRSVKGSTRLEAKRQRRRDGRDAGRRRAPVLSEAEFLSRRESVDRQMVVRQQGEQTQIAVLEDDVLVENFVTSSGNGSLVGNVYLGRVQNVLPSMEAAFVDIGRGRNAVLYAGEVDWDAAGLAGKARRIEQALQTGDSVLVQVTKDPIGHKGARLTTQISLPGRFLVYVPGGGATGISRKLPDNERKRLKEILKRIVPDNAGVIIRTASEGTSEDELDRDVRRLQAQWEIIKEKSETSGTHAPELLYAEPDLLIKVIRDLFTEDFSSLTVQGGDAWETIESYVQHVAPDLMSRLAKHVGKNDVFTERRINEQISKALDRKVWLPSGGYLVIDRTEAMTVIDVNTGKYTGSGGNLEETVTRNNLEAAEEVVRQLRLRDVGGIIVIDFIDMVLESNRDLVLRRLTECLGRDRTRHQVAEVTSLGLVQMTRKRVGTGLLEAYSSTCEHCRGRGLLVSTDSVHHHDHGGGRRNRKGKSQQDDGKQAEQRSDEHKGSDKGSDKSAEHKAGDKGPEHNGSGKNAEHKNAEHKNAEHKNAEHKNGDHKNSDHKGADKGSKKNRNKGQSRGADVGQSAKAGDDSRANGAAEQSLGSGKQPVHGDAEQGTARPAASDGSRQQDAGQQDSRQQDAGQQDNGGPVGEQRFTAEAAAEPAVAEQRTPADTSSADSTRAKNGATGAADTGGRARRKVSRPAGGTGERIDPVVVTNPAPAQSAQSVAQSSAESVEPARPVRRGRRAVSRQSGPPTET